MWTDPAWRAERPAQAFADGKSHYGVSRSKQAHLDTEASPTRARNPTGGVPAQCRHAPVPAEARRLRIRRRTRRGGGRGVQDLQAAMGAQDAHAGGAQSGLRAVIHAQDQDAHVFPQRIHRHGGGARHNLERGGC